MDAKEKSETLTTMQERDHLYNRKKAIGGE